MTDRKRIKWAFLASGWVIITGSVAAYLAEQGAPYHSLGALGTGLLVAGLVLAVAQDESW